RSVFDNINAYTNGLNGRYGAASGAATYAARAEVQNYETARAFFEAWSARQHTQTFGVIFWMLNNAWPSVHWNLYDYYFKPGGGYFGSRKADEPLHILYDYQDRSVRVVNSTLAAASGMTAVASLYNVPSLAQQYTTQATVNAPADAF